MNRKFVSFPITDLNDLKKKTLHWLNQYEVCCFLDNNGYSSNYKSFDCIAAAGVISKITAPPHGAFVHLQQFFDSAQDWIFGHLNYDLKNELEELFSYHKDGIGFPDLFFFVPRVVLLVNDNELSIGSIGKDPRVIYDEISGTNSEITVDHSTIDIRSRFSKEEYISAIQQLQQHIRRGDCYEVNFCQEFFSLNAAINPLQVFSALNSISPNPFGAFYKMADKYLCCASPERYLRKEADKIISQPIKGTWNRNHENALADQQNKNALFNSNKERTENVMIVDLVRNDLSRVCEEGTVEVEELYGIYSFPQVHQMISTITGTLKKEVTPIAAIKATFPMGSMTGAPKKRVMQLIEQYEKTKRGLFSGALGYIKPGGDFDFNVVIRSILYNEEQKYISFEVGSAITFYSNPEKEYEECMLKAEAIIKTLTLK